MSDDSSVLALGHGYVDSHSYLDGDIEIVGVDAIAGINGAVGEVRQASSIFVNPGFEPGNIHNQGVQ